MKKTLKYKDIQKPSIIKRIIKYISLGIYMIFLLALIIDVLNFHSHTIQERKESYIFWGQVLVMTLIFVAIKLGAFSKDRDAVSGTCDKKEFKEIIKHEDFVKIEGIGEGKIYESKLWLNVSGVYIPKSYIKCFYVLIGNAGIFKMIIVLINGRDFVYEVGANKKTLERSVNKFKEMLPKAILMDGHRYLIDEIGPKLLKQYKGYIDEGATFMDFFNSKYKFDIK